MSWEKRVKLKPSDFYSNYFNVQEKPKIHCNSCCVCTEREFYAEMDRFHRYETTVKYFFEIACTSSRSESFPFSFLVNKRKRTGRVVAGALK